MIKSAVRIVDSDDDEEVDGAFFERERDLRMRMAQRAMTGDLPSSGTKKAEKKRGKKRPPDTPQTDVWVVNSPKEGSVVSDMVTLESEGDENKDLWTNDDESENGDTEVVRPVKKRMVRRAVSISSDEE